MSLHSLVNYSCETGFRIEPTHYSFGGSSLVVKCDESKEWKPNPSDFSCECMYICCLLFMCLFRICCNTFPICLYYITETKYCAMCTLYNELSHTCSSHCMAIIYSFIELCCCFSLCVYLTSFLALTNLGQGGTIQSVLIRVEVCHIGYYFPDMDFPVDADN